jgi:hypothetical protein
MCDCELLTCQCVLYLTGRVSIGWHPSASVSMAGTDAVVGRWDSEAKSPVREYFISGQYESWVCMVCQ